MRPIVSPAAPVHRRRFARLPDAVAASSFAFETHIVPCRLFGSSNTRHKANSGGRRERGKLRSLSQGERRTWRKGATRAAQGKKQATATTDGIASAPSPECRCHACCRGMIGDRQRNVHEAADGRGSESGCCIGFVAAILPSPENCCCCCSCCECVWSDHLRLLGRARRRCGSLVLHGTV